ncbi:hypothetical protein BRD56_06000 [Thermoplasmatales archaeon SW_10_69_26]|nr:MAG: hypothetical protein BRD56_06000 [Thermoplasmatales archaeon SW_10_69_26]
MTRKLLIALVLALALLFAATPAAGETPGTADRLAPTEGESSRCPQTPAPSVLGLRAPLACEPPSASPTPGCASSCSAPREQAPSIHADPIGERDEEGLQAPSAATDCRSHPPIVVVGDQGPTGFAIENAAGDDVPRPGSGVVDGEGTEDDPYVIEGWCIEGRRASVSFFWVGARTGTTGIHLADTSAHVIIRGNDLTQLERGIHLEDADNVTVRANHIHDVQHGVDVDQARNLTVETNAIKWTNEGIEASGAYGLTVRGNELSAPNDRANAAAKDDGIKVTDSDGAAIVANVLHNYDGTAVRVADTAAAEVEGNELLEGPSFASRAIHLLGTEDTEVRDNVLYDFRSGLRLEGTQGTLVTGNDIDENSLFGVSFEAGSSIAIRDNVVTRSNDAIEAYEGETVTEGVRIENNTLTGNHNRGIELEHGRDILVRNNTVTNNGRSGVWANGADEVVIRSNRILDNDRSGVIVARSEAVLVEDNLVRHNGWGAHTRSVFRGGIGVNGNAQEVTIEANTIEDSYWHGLTVWDEGPEASTTIHANDVSGSAFVGIYVLRSNGTTVTDNALTDNRRDVTLGTSTASTVTGNAMRSGLSVVVDDEDDHRHAIADNTVNGEPVRYLLDVADTTVERPAGQVILADATNVTVQRPTIGNVTEPIQVLASEDVTVQAPTLTDTGVALVADGSQRTRIHDGRVSEAMAGLVLADTGNTTVEGFQVENASVGVLARSTDAATVTDTNLSADAAGLLFERSRAPELTRVTVEGALDGIALNDVDAARLQAVAVEQADRGLTVEDGRGLTLEDSQLEAATGARLRGVEQPHLEANRITGGDVGIRLAGASAPTLIDNEVDSQLSGLQARSTDGLALSGNAFSTGVDLDEATLRGTDQATGDTVAGEPLILRSGVEGREIEGPVGQLLLADATNVTLTGAVFEEVAAPVQVLASEGLRIENVTVRNATVGIELSDAVDAHLAGLHAEGNAIGIHADALTASTIQGSRLEEGQRALVAEDAAASRIHNNTIDGAEQGIWLDGDQQANRLVHNRLTGNEEAIVLAETGAGEEVHRNDIVGNDVGLVDDTQDGPTPDARHNWWGCSEGPDHADCDDIEGEARYDPWSTEPHEQAGAS